MVWGAFSHRDKSELTFVDMRMNAESYTELLDAVLIPFQDEHTNFATFEHDNAPCHSAEYTFDWLVLNQIDVLEVSRMQPRSQPDRKHLA